MHDIEDRSLTRHRFHGEWNCTFAPVPRPAPLPGPQPAQPDPLTRGPMMHALARPELTGMTRDDLTALAAGLELPDAAAREQWLHLARGGPRTTAPRPPGPTALPLPARLLATILRQRLGLPIHVLGYLLGVTAGTISPAITRTAELLASQHITITPGPARLTTLAAFRDYAAASGITIPEPARNRA
jgi:hypothetical protein